MYSELFEWLESSSYWLKGFLQIGFSEVSVNLIKDCYSNVNSNNGDKDYWLWNKETKNCLKCNQMVLRNIEFIHNYIGDDSIEEEKIIVETCKNEKCKYFAVYQFPLHKEFPHEEKNNEIVSQVATESLIQDLRQIIEQARGRVAATANYALSIMYWQIGRRINTEVLGNQRAEYGKQIVASVARQLRE